MPIDKFSSHRKLIESGIIAQQYLENQNVQLNWLIREPCPNQSPLRGLRGKGQELAEVNFCLPNFTNYIF